MTRIVFCAWVLGAASASVGCGSEGSPAASPGATTGGVTASGVTGTSAGGSGATSATGNTVSGGTVAGNGTTGSGATSTGGTSTASATVTGGSPSTGGATAGSTSGATGGSTTTSGGLPEGNAGIAARHPGDVGIDTDSAVVFADDFERYAQSSELNNRWDAVYQNQDVKIITDAANVYAGKQALEFTIPQMTAELSDATDKVISPEQDVLFLRYYSKFMPPYDVVGSSHNGSSISAHYFINGMATPGVPANGTNKFLVNYEDWRGEAATPSPGPLNVYVYQPEQRSMWGDHFFPTGLVLPNTSIPMDFGATFVARPDVTPELDRWYCYEYMVKANTPGMRDGRIAFWLDGKLLADFGNLRLRDVATLKIDRFGLSFHIGSNANGVSKKWYDNVVAATSYVGPISP